MRPCDDKKVPYYQGRLYMPVQICSSKVFLFYTDFIHQNIEFFIKGFFSPQLYKEVGSYFLAVLSWISALQEWIQGKDICQFSELPYPPIKILKLVISWSLHRQVSNLVNNRPYAGLTWVWVIEFSRGDTKLERFLP